jgi:hypothetical protein
MNKTTYVISMAMLFALVSIAISRPTYIGYSGAPGSSGTCASSCHGSSGGTIRISGFPEQYIPGQTYSITISHDGGNTIKQFNGSCRIADGDRNAGVISAGSNTQTYNVYNETNGIHFSSTDRDSGEFNWEAPPGGTGEVRLYIAGHQGSRSGPNSTIVLTSTEQTTAIDDVTFSMPDRYYISQNYPNPFNAATTIKYGIPERSHVTIEIYDILGRQVETLVDEERPAGQHQIVWRADNQPSGVYFYHIQAGEYESSDKMVFLR